MPQPFEAEFQPSGVRGRLRGDFEFEAASGFRTSKICWVSHRAHVAGGRPGVVCIKEGEAGRAAMQLSSAPRHYLRESVSASPSRWNVRRPRTTAELKSSPASYEVDVKEASLPSKP